jgi:tetratricopeptide (TPR) repeat protein
MNNVIHALPVVLAAWILLGCASTNDVDEHRQISAQLVSDVGQDQDVDQKSDVASTAGTSDLTAQGFSEEVLYQLLVAEFAGQRGNAQLAVRNYLEVAQRSRDPQIAERATRIAVFGGDEDRALEAAKLWKEIEPSSREANQVYALLLVRTGRTDEAVAELKSQLSGAQGSLAEELHQIADVLGREKAGVEVMERLIKGHEDNPDVLFALAEFLTHTGDLERAKPLLERVVAMDPRNIRAAVLYASVLQTTGETEQSLAILSQALEDNPDARELRLAYARLLVGAKQYDKALAQFQQLSEQTPDDEGILYALGLLFLQREQPEAARTQFNRLLELDKRVEAAHYYLGQLAELEDSPDAAMQYYAKVGHGEHYLAAQIRYAVLLGQQEGIAQAQQFLRGLSQSNPEEATRLRRAEAEILIEAGRLEEAMAIYNDALAENPDDTELLYARAMLAEKMGRLDILEADLREILTQDPDNADALNALGYTLADRTDRHQEALELITRALNLKPHDYYILDSMGWVLYRMGRYEEAVEHLRRAMAVNEDPEVAAHLGEVLWMMGNKEAARNVWEKALRSTPEDERLLEVMERFGQ